MANYLSLKKLSSIDRLLLLYLLFPRYEWLDKASEGRVPLGMADGSLLVPISTDP